MKKILSLVMVICLLICLVGCVSTTTTTTNTSQDNYQDSDSNYEENDTQNGIWTFNNYVDEFNEETNEGYVTNTEYFNGTFSNSATTNSKLSVQLVIDGKYTKIELYEYGSQLVKTNMSDGEYYSVKVKDSNGNIKELGAVAIPGVSGLVLLKKSGGYEFSDYIKEALINGYDLKINITHERYKSTTYSFSVESDNFSDFWN